MELLVCVIKTRGTLCIKIKDALKTIHPLNKNENQRSISILTLKFVSNMVEITFEFVRPLFQIVNCP